MINNVIIIPRRHLRWHKIKPLLCRSKPSQVAGRIFPNLGESSALEFLHSPNPKIPHSQSKYCPLLTIQILPTTYNPMAKVGEEKPLIARSLFPHWSVVPRCVCLSNFVALIDQYQRHNQHYNQHHKQRHNQHHNQHYNQHQNQYQRQH